MAILISIFTITFFFISAPLWATDLTKASLQELVDQRPDLIQDIKSGKDEGTTVVFVIKDTQGRMKTWTEEKKNLDGVVIGKRVDKYTYYSTDNVNEIIQEKYEGAKLTLTSKQRIKHYKDGTQPDVIPMSIAIPMGL